MDTISQHLNINGHVHAINQWGDGRMCVDILNDDEIDMKEDSTSAPVDCSRCLSLISSTHRLADWIESLINRRVGELIASGAVVGACDCEEVENTFVL